MHLPKNCIASLSNQREGAHSDLLIIFTYSVSKQKLCRKWHSKPNYEGEQRHYGKEFFKSS